MGAQGPACHPSLVKGTGRHATSRPQEPACLPLRHNPRLPCRAGAATRGPMLRSATFWIVLGIAGLVAADLTRNDGAALTFLGRELLALIGWIAFWR